MDSSIADKIKGDFASGTFAVKCDALDVYLLPNHMGLFPTPRQFLGCETVHLRIAAANIGDNAFVARVLSGADVIEVTVPWIAVYFMRRAGDGVHCIDWALLSQYRGVADTRAMLAEYRRVQPTAGWPEPYISIGQQIDFDRLGSAPALASAAGVSDNGVRAQVAVTRARARWGYAQVHEGEDAE